MHCKCRTALKFRLSGCLILGAPLEPIAGSGAEHRGFSNIFRNLKLHNIKYTNKTGALLTEHLTMPLSSRTHYELLNLPIPTITSKPPSPQEIKAAYRLALLAHHPDKSSPQLPTKNPNVPTIDAIKAAYHALSTPSLRAEYDRTVLLHPPTKSTGQKSGYTGSETLDLDDLVFDEVEGVWYLGCRCGEKRGYVVTEGDLEREERLGGREIVVGCRGCSLWIRVGFGVVEECDDEEAQCKEGG